MKREDAMNELANSFVDELLAQPSVTGRLPTEPNQQALPGTPAAAIEMAECRGRSFRAYCPLCDQLEGHAEGCGIEGLNKMIDEQFLYGSVSDRPELSPATVEDIKAAAKDCRVILVTGHEPLPAGLLAALGNLEGVRVVTGLRMAKEREAVDRALNFDTAQVLDLVRDHDVTVVGHNRLRAAEFLGIDYIHTPTIPSNRSQTGRHGPKDSFHRKKKKGRS